MNLPSDVMLEDEHNYAHRSDDRYIPRKRPRVEQKTEVHTANPENDQIVLDDGLVDLSEVILVSHNQFVTVNVEQLKEYEKIAEDCKKYEDKIKEYEGLIKEMQHKEQQDQLIISKLLKESKINKKKTKKLRHELRDAKLRSKSNVMKYLSKIFNAEQLTFFSMQVTNSGKKSKGRRYTPEEKALSLILYKHSPKNYRNMRKIFILPTKRTLGRFSAHLIFHTGIDTKMFAHIKDIVSGLPELDKYCTLSWDEVSLKAPHLIKGVRNNLMTKNLKHEITKRWSSSTDGYVKSKSLKRQPARIASWMHVQGLYRHNLLTSTKSLPKISPEHMNPKKSKMKVSVATQVFSDTYGKLMLDYVGNGTVPKTYSNTAEILLFFNDLFDSINGSFKYKGLKGPVTASSVHFKFWDWALSMLSKMRFYEKSTGKITNRTSVLNHFQSTVKGYMEICKKCLQLNMTEISIRYLLLNVQIFSFS